MARQRFELAMALLRSDLEVLQNLHSQRLLWEMPLQEKPQEQDLLVALVWANLETLLATLRVLREKRQRRLEPGWPVRRERARRCSRCPGPSAFSQETPAVRKCNRAARCGDHPIFARYPLPHTRRGPADCDNRCSRSQRKRARRA